VIEKILNVYVPKSERICINSGDHDQVYDIKFHGNPVNIFPLRNSSKEKIKENNKTNEILFSEKGPMIKTAIPKKNDKNNGIKIREKKIRFLNCSS
tara:strand:- start:111 stop:398 length:288 start_codon:yes stop_codon:yes gene_type:complete